MGLTPFAVDHPGLHWRPRGALTGFKQGAYGHPLDDHTHPSEEEDSCSQGWAPG